MAIIRWDRIRDLDSAQSDMNRLFDRFFECDTSAEGRVQSWIPAVDLVETDSDLVLRADLPGMKEDEVRIEIQNSVLTISGERRAQHEQDGEQDGAGFHRLERAFGRFSRSLNLPQGVDAERVAASFSDGVLEVRVPKPEPEPAQPTRVAIRTGGGSVEGTGNERPVPERSAPEK